jgi:transcriptional regulator with XRE-family HTH domain
MVLVDLRHCKREYIRSIPKTLSRSGHPIRESFFSSTAQDQRTCSIQYKNRKEAIMTESRFNGDKVRELRCQRHWTQRQLARAAGVAPQIISHMEKSLPLSGRSSTVVAVAHTLGVSAQDLIWPPLPAPAKPKRSPTDEAIDLFKQLTPEERRTVELLAKFCLTRQKKRQSGRSPKTVRKSKMAHTSERSGTKEPRTPKPFRRQRDG